MTPWLDPTSTALAISKGLSVVNYFSYYLDQQTPPGTDPPNQGPWYYLWGDTWQTFYAYDPVSSANVSAADAHYVLGGTASLWGEQVDSSGAGMQALARAWPRAAATAERLWSDANVVNVTSAAPRLEHFRCHIAQWGIPAGPLAIASEYGFCWSGAWQGVPTPTPPPTGGDPSGLTTGQAAGLAVGSALAGALVLLGAQFLQQVYVKPRMAGGVGGGRYEGLALSSGAAPATQGRSEGNGALGLLEEEVALDGELAKSPSRITYGAIPRERRL